ncbi:MAG: phosphoglucosamine mutase [Candidatus Wallbacteria bacterium]|nr:phosphoglucosamine mutase [Candidatus Wallbacteria bacterium]
MKKYFGTDGVRGLANKHPMTAEFALQLGMASACVIKGKVSDRNPTVLLGKDPRLSSDFLAAAFAAGCASCGLEIHKIGVITTPGISYLTQCRDFLFGAMVSASHNPYQDNGIKLFSSRGIKIPDAWEEEIERQIDDHNFNLADSKGIGRIKTDEGLKQDYLDMLKSQLASSAKLKRGRVVIDCANGSTSAIARDVFQHLFAAVFINDHPDGININQNCGSTRMQVLCDRVRSERADFGFAFDGDGDRVLFCDETGEILDGDYVLAICALDMKKRGTLKNNLLIGTVMTNLGMIKAMEKQGIEVRLVQVGDKYVYEEMVKSAASLGGEQSGHIIFPDLIQTGDGLLTALKFLQIIGESGIPLSEHRKIFSKYPQALLNLRIKNRSDYTENRELQKTLTDLADQQGRDSRLVVRPSGTEPLLRIMVESRDKNSLDFLLEKAEGIIRQHIKVEE